MRRADRPNHPRLPPDRRVHVALVAVVVALAALGGTATLAAFTGTTSNTSNGFGSGSVAVTDNDDGSALFSATGMQPEDSLTRCINVSYSGSLPAGMRLYGTPGGTGLASYLDLVVTRGSGATTGGSCTGFVGDSTDYIGQGAGVIYRGTLAAFPGSFATGFVDPDPAWTNGEARSYRFQVTLRTDTAAEGLSAAPTFTWEARSN